jgi:hypothetical protein
MSNMGLTASGTTRGRREATPHAPRRTARQHDRYTAARIPTRLHDDVDRIAAANGVTVSAAIREGLQLWVQDRMRT